MKSILFMVICSIIIHHRKDTGRPSSHSPFSCYAHTALPQHLGRQSSSAFNSTCTISSVVIRREKTTITKLVRWAGQQKAELALAPLQWDSQQDWLALVLHILHQVYTIPWAGQLLSAQKHSVAFYHCSSTYS